MQKKAAPTKKNDNKYEEEDEEEKKQGYSWEKQFERSWESLTEDEKGLRITASEKKRRKSKTREARKIRRGMTRNLFLIVDFSKSMNENDMRPSRMAATLNGAEGFILSYFDQNPISQLGVIVTRDSIAEKLTELSGNPSKHINALKSKTGVEGEASLQNALEVAKTTLSFVPRYGTREIVVIYGSLTSCDPGDIYETIDTLKKENIKVSIIGLSAEVHVCKATAEATGGSYFVSMNEDHFKELLAQHGPPPPANSKMETTLIKMGFPQRKTDSYPSLCVCHSVPKYGGYFCPNCKSKFCELPIDCSICNLTLISSPHLARSYHHLFPVSVFTQSISSEIGATSCFACLRSFSSLAPAFSCTKCNSVYCSECDDYIHDSLHNCPGCEMSSKVES